MDFYFWFPYGIILLGVLIMVFLSKAEGSVLLFFGVGYIFGRTQKQEKDNAK